jgi:hypothetical protein
MIKLAAAAPLSFAERHHGGETFGALTHAEGRISP